MHTYQLGNELSNAIVNLLQGLCLVVGVGLPDNNAGYGGGDDLLLRSLGDAGAGRRRSFRNSHFCGGGGEELFVLGEVHVVEQNIRRKVREKKRKKKGDKTRRRKENICRRGMNAT